ncbi:hypothetical protein [Streptomyces olivochromogenes]|uniref:Uncharacterized protein n=1 Tax=Streptomyces olivochromogenes TaxID=1963 RepID=A0A250VQE7_STROL|nr:hypothetical protein [Streptomyces olivochromogenes]KUN38971.1 hypothetical protein AQJ27_43075 [Streptomyces olivochromogenes]GAX56453.1 hypothetical protein SO3561_08021 [Streptomyces olivochromogenes]
MSENTEDVVRHAESAARSLAQFVTDLQYRGTGIEYPVEASRIYRDLTPRRRRDGGRPHSAQDLRGRPPGSGPPDDRLPG